MPDLPDRSKREEELAVAILSALRATQGDWSRGLDSQALRRSVQDDVAAVLLRSFEGSSEVTAEQLGIAVGDVTRAGMGFSGVMAAGIAGNIGLSIQRTFSGLDLNTSRAALVDAVLASPRWATMAATEVTRAATAGSEYVANAWVTLRGMAVATVWRTSADAKVCPFCAPLDGLTKEVFSRFAGDGPPGHPNCRCYLDYSWLSRN